MWMIKDKVDYRFGMGDSDEERGNSISEDNQATSNVTSTTADHRGDDVGTNGQRVDDSFKLSMEGTEATPLAVTSKILHKGFLGVLDQIVRVSVLMELLTR